MKKRVLCLLMALLMCLPFAVANAATKTSADFSDLKDLDAATKAKFDAMISAGIFDGVSEGSFGLKEEMNRAQFAKVAALIFGLKVDTSLKVSSFKDVSADDPANGYALPYIEAIKAAGITDGTGKNTYSPAGDVTKEQLAGFLVKGLGLAKEADATPGVKDDTVSDWAKGYVALALEKKLLTNGADGKLGGTSNATRDLLVLSAYESQQQYVEKQLEEKKKEEEEKKKKEEEEKKKKEEEEAKNNPPVYSPPYVPPTLAAPTADVASGVVPAGTQVTLTPPTVSASVYYTTDLSNPTTSSTLYTGLITINSTTTIKAIAVQPGYTNSAVLTVSYTVEAPTPSVTAVEGAPQDDGTKMVEVLVTPNLTGTVYYVVVPASSSAPSATQVVNGQNAMDVAAIEAQHTGALASLVTPILITLPSDAMAYDVYVVLSAEGSTSTPVKVSVTTPLPAYTPPPPGVSVTNVVYDALYGNLIVFFSGVLEEEEAEGFVYSLTIEGSTPNQKSPDSATLLDGNAEVALEVGDWFVNLADEAIIHLSVTGAGIAPGGSEFVIAKEDITFIHE